MFEYCILPIITVENILPIVTIVNIFEAYKYIDHKSRLDTTFKVLNNFYLIL